MKPVSMVNPVSTGSKCNLILRISSKCYADVLLQIHKSEFSIYKVNGYFELVLDDPHIPAHKLFIIMEFVCESVCLSICAVVVGYRGF